MAKTNPIQKNSNYNKITILQGP